MTRARDDGLAVYRQMFADLDWTLECCDAVIFEIEKNSVTLELLPQGERMRLRDTYLRGLELRDAASTWRAQGPYVPNLLASACASAESAHLKLKTVEYAIECKLAPRDPITGLKQLPLPCSGVPPRPGMLANPY